MLFLIIILIPIKIFFDFYFAQKVICIPPNVFSHVFAPPGTGKTTLAAHLVRDSFVNHGTKKVYSNVPIRGALKLDFKDLGKHEYRDCVFLIDEAGIELSNRNWQKNLDDDQIYVLKKHRHYNIDIYVFSQHYNDVDNKLRELTTQILFLKKSRIPFFVHAKAVYKTMDLVNGQFVEYYEWDKSNSFRFFIANTWAYFNSYDTTQLPQAENEMQYIQTDL